MATDRRPLYATLIFLGILLTALFILQPYSAFWRFVRRTLSVVDPASVEDQAWSSRLAWTNLAKFAPWARRQPRVQV